MTDWLRLDAHGAVRLYLEERRKRSSVPGTLSREPDMPRSTAEPDGRFETLILLMAGVDSEAVRALELITYGTAGVETRFTADAPGFGSLVEWEQADPETRGELVQTEEQIAIPLTHAAIARVLGKERSYVRGMVADAYHTVTINLARLKRRIVAEAR